MKLRQAGMPVNHPCIERLAAFSALPAPIKSGVESGPAFFATTASAYSPPQQRQ